MKSNSWSAFGILTSITLVLAMMPSHAWAQAGGAGAAGGGMGGLQQLRQVMNQLDLTADQKKSVRDILKQAMQDARDTMQGVQDAAPQERMEKMQAVQKTMADAKEKFEDQLTPQQKAKYYPLMAKAQLKQMSDLLAAVKSAATRQNVSDDLRKQLGDALDDTQKTLDGFMDDADAVKDADSAKDFSDKLQQTQKDLRNQVVSILGQQDAMKLLQSARKTMRPAAFGQGRGGNASREETATTAPAAK